MVFLPTDQSAPESSLPILGDQSYDDVPHLKAGIATGDKHSVTAADGGEEGLGREVQILYHLTHCAVAVLEPELQHVFPGTMFKPGPVYAGEAGLLIHVGMRVGADDIPTTEHTENPLRILAVYNRYAPHVQGLKVTESSL
jgi:hypothetical protein